MNELTVSRQEQANLVHSRILANGQIAASALLAMCEDLKKMRDEKLYEELNYSSFEDYAEQACGIKQRQAYSYIAAYERLGSQYIEKHANLGITKLEAISQISSFEREEFLAEVDVEDISTRELKEEVQRFKNQVEQLTLDLQEAEDEKKELSEKLSSAEYDAGKLSAELEDIKSKPTDVIVAEPDDETVKKAVEQAKAEDAELIKKLKQQVKDEKAKTKAAEDGKASAVKDAKEKAVKEANERIDKLVAESKVKDAKLAEALKAAKVAGADEDTIAVRILFNDLQSTANELKKRIAIIKEIDSEKADKLINIISKTMLALFGE